MKARQNLGQIMNEVSVRSDRYIIESLIQFLSVFSSHRIKSLFRRFTQNILHSLQEKVLWHQYESQ